MSFKQKVLEPAAIVFTYVSLGFNVVSAINGIFQNYHLVLIPLILSLILSVSSLIIKPKNGKNKVRPLPIIDIAVAVHFLIVLLVLIPLYTAA